MADDKKLGIKVSASGGDQAAKEVAKPEAAIEDLGKQAAETKLLIDRITEALDKAGDQSPETAKQFQEVAAQLDNVEEKARAAVVAQKQLAAAGPAVAGTQRNAGLAVLEFSRAIEDAQYGIRGVLNNIPQLVMLMGMGGGVAGAVSIAAVALTQLLPLLMQTGEASKEEAKKFEEAQDAAAEAAKRLEDRLASLRQAKAEIDASKVNDLGTAAIERWKAEGDEIDRVLSLMRAVQASRLEQVSAGAGLETARVNAAEKAGEISKTDAIVARARIAEEADARALQIRQQAAQDEIELGTRRVEAAKAALADVEKAEQNAKRNARAAEAAAVAGERTGPAREAAEKELEAAKERLRLAMGSVAAQAGGGLAGETAGMARAREESAAARDAVKIAQEKFDAAAREAEAYEASKESLAGAEKAQKEALKIATERREEAEKTAAALATQVEHEQELIRLRLRSEARGAATRSELRGVETASSVGEEQRRAEKEAAEKEAKRLRDEEAAALQEQIKAPAPGFVRRGERVEAASLEGAAAAIEGAAKGFANGATIPELESALFSLAEAVNTAPAAMRSTVQAAVAPLQRAADEFRRKLAELESQVRNNPNR